MVSVSKRLRKRTQTYTNAYIAALYRLQKGLRERHCVVEPARIACKNLHRRAFPKRQMGNGMTEIVETNKKQGYLMRNRVLLLGLGWWVVMMAGCAAAPPTMKDSAPKPAEAFEAGGEKDDEEDDVNGVNTPDIVPADEMSPSHGGTEAGIAGSSQAQMDAQTRELERLVQGYREEFGVEDYGATSPRSCNEVCDLSDAVCISSRKICDIATQNAEVTGFADKCTWATGECDKSKKSCTHCSQ